ncbi:MAG TPA: hypothetical protein VE422_47570 [Terriglobia bacterium]|nr:hypothetical protein [Terriglobia bacterium]
MKLLKCVLILAMTAVCGLAQHPAGNLLIIETANQTSYARDVTEYSLLATNAGPTTEAPARNFQDLILIGDIVSVNGQPAKGTVVETATLLLLRPNPIPGQAIADTQRGGLIQWNFEIQGEDGRPIGSILVSGMNGGPPPPGQTRQILQGSYVVVGGTGAFLGARGYMGAAVAAAGRMSPRAASVSEDPANRRFFPGGSVRQGIYLLSMATPEIVAAANRPAAVVHASDYRPVTEANPAGASEILVLHASGLGPTRPALETGQLFTTDPFSVVNSPLEIIVNGTSAEVLFASGLPGTADRYQVSFRMPDNISGPVASIHLISAWIAGSEFKIAAQ